MYLLQWLGRICKLDEETFFSRKYFQIVKKNSVEKINVTIQKYVNFPDTCVDNIKVMDMGVLRSENPNVKNTMNKRDC